MRRTIGRNLQNSRHGRHETTVKSTKLLIFCTEWMHSDAPPRCSVQRISNKRMRKHQQFRGKTQHEFRPLQSDQENRDRFSTKSRSRTGHSPSRRAPNRWFRTERNSFRRRKARASRRPELARAIPRDRVRRRMRKTEKRCKWSAKRLLHARRRPNLLIETISNQPPPAGATLRVRGSYFLSRPTGNSIVALWEAGGTPAAGTLFALSCRFPSFAERTLRGGSSMVGGCARAREFLTLAARQLKSEVERAALETGQRSDSAQNLNDFMSNGQLQWFSRRRFSLGTCVDGLSRLFSHLYGIRLHVKEAGNGEVWSDDVVKVGVAHEREGELGAIYCDLIGREEKSAAHDCHFTLRGGRRLASGAYQNPLVVLTCNFPRGDPVTYLSSSQMGTLFHEMGHAMHSMLARARYQHVTGTRCATDVAEVPSHLMEIFARDERVLRLFARDDVARRAASVAAKENHIDTQLQIIYALTDLQLHDENVNDDVNPIDIYHQNLKEYFPLNIKDMENRIQYFSHFSHYGARYYSYLWARAVSNLLWKRLFSADPLSRKAGEWYRREFLSHGGAKDPREILANTLGYEPTMKELVESLMMSPN